MKHLFSYSTALLTAIFFLSGCSMNGWTVKEIPDDSNITIGNIVTVVQKDGTIKTGEYIGIQDIPISEYIDFYNATISRASLDQLLPRFGENIQITTKVAENKVWDGQFISFDSKNISIKLKGKNEPNEIFISSLTMMSKIQGKTLREMQFRKLFEDGDIPLRTSIVLKNAGDDVIIPLNTIEQITAHSGYAHNILSDLDKQGFPSYRLVIN